MVTRSDSVGLLGVPIDSVTVIVTSSSLCYVSALFAPLEVVNLKPNGHFTLRLFRNVLRKLNGRAGFGFCPGFKEENFPSHFNFQKHGLEVTRQPFTRVHATGCPVFFQQRKPRPGGQELGLELCTRCLQVGMGVCETLKDSGAEGEIPGLIKSLTKSNHSLGKNHHDHHNELFSERDHLSSCEGHRSVSPDNSGSDIRTDPHSKGTLPSSKQNSSPKSPTKKQRHSAFSESVSATASSSFPSSKVPSAITAKSNSTNHVELGTVQKGVKPYRIITPCVKNRNSSSDTTSDGYGNLENSISLPIVRLKRCDSASLDYEPPLLMAETSVPSSPQLCIDEDADPDILKPAVDGEPDAKQQCLRCPLCAETFSMQSSLDQHLQQRHQALTKDVAATGLEPSSPKQAEDHKPSLQKHKTCPVCTQHFVSKDELEVHLRERHNTRLHACRFCGLKFALKSNLSSHLLSHTGSAHLKCQECEAKFSNKKKYAEHIRQHMGSLPFFCKICTKLFSREKTYEEHMERHKTRRAMKSLVGTEKMTQGIMDRARRCLEDKAQMAASCSDKKQVSSLSASNCTSLKSESTTGEHDEPMQDDASSDTNHSVSEHSHTAESLESKHALSSNLHLLSVVSLAQAKLDQVYTVQTAQLEQAKPGLLTSGVELRDLALQETIESARELGSTEHCKSTSTSGAVRDSVDKFTSRAKNNSNRAENLASKSEDRENPLTHAATSIVNSADGRMHNGGNPGTVLQGLNAPSPSVITTSFNPSSAPHNSASARTNPVNQSSSTSSHKDCQSEDSRLVMAGDDAEGEEQEGKCQEIEIAEKHALIELEKRERQIQEKERALKEREMAMRKINLSLMQQLFLAQLAQGRMPAPSSVQSKGGISVPRFALPRIPVTALPIYTLSENGIATRFGPAVPSLEVLQNSGLKTSDRDFLMAMPHMTVSGDMAPPRPQPRPAAQVQQEAPQKVELSIISPFGHAASGAVKSTGDGTLKGVKRREPGGDKSRFPEADGAVRCRRPMTTPTPPQPDVTLNFLSSSKGPTSGAPPASATILTSSTAQTTAASTNHPATDSPAKQSSVTGVPTLGGMAMLQQIWKLESKLPESAKQFLPSAEKRKQPTSKTKPPVFHNFTPSQPNISSTELPSKGLDGSFKTKRRTPQLPPEGSETGSVDRSILSGWSGGMMMGKDKLRSPVMIVPPYEMQRLLSLTKSKTPPPVTSQNRPRLSTSLDNTLPSPPSSVSAQRESANVDGAQLSPAVGSNDSLRSPVSSDNSAHSPVNVPSALNPPANVGFNPLAHAVTSSVNITGSCMQKGVKQRRPANAENYVRSPTTSNSSPHLSVSANGMLRSPVTSDAMRHSPTPSVTSQHSPATQQLTPTQSELSPPPPAYQQRASRSSPNNNTLAAQLAAKAAAITAARMAALSPTGLSVHFPTPTVIHSAPAITHSLSHSVIQSTAPTVARTLSQSVLHSATSSVASNPPHSGINSSAASIVSVSSSSVSLPHWSSTVTVASRQTAVPYASPPPLYLPNAAGGLPITMPVPDLNDATPIDLTKPGSRSSCGGKSLDGDRTVGKETANNAAVRENGVSTGPQVHNSLLLRKFLLDGDIPSPAEKMNLLTSQLAALHSRHMSPELAALAVNSHSQPVPNQQTAAVLQLQSHSPSVVSPQDPSPTHGIPVSLHAPASSQASPLLPHVFSLQGPMSPQSSTLIPVRSHAVGQPQVSLTSPQLSALQHPAQSQRGLRLLEGPSSQVRLTRIDGIPVPISLTMLAQVQGMAPPRFVMPTQGLIPPQGLVSPSQATTQQRMPSPVRAVASPPPYSQQGMSSPRRALGSPPPYPQEPRPAPPTNFLLVSRTTQAAAQTEDCAVDRKSTVPLGGFTWHRPAALDPSYGPQHAEEQNAGTDGDLTQHQTQTEDGSTNPDDQGSPRTAFSAWQEQFLQTLKKQRRHQEQQQRVFDAQRQQLLQQELPPPPKQRRPRKPRDPNKPPRQSRPGKKNNDASQPETAGEGSDHTSGYPFSPPPNFNTSTMSVQNNSTESTASSGSEALLSMPVIVDEQPAKKPRKRQSRKRKSTRKVDVNAMEQEHNNNGEEDCARESGTGTRLQQSEYGLSCDSCGKVFLSEVDILHHECYGE